MYTIYIIGTLKPGFFYVGMTFDYRYRDRIAEHMKGRGAMFTRRHGVLWYTRLEECVPTREAAKKLEWEWVLRLRSCSCVCGGGSSSPDLRGSFAA